ncbi:FAD-dependent monooxygenase [Nonomuraea endophytica]|uniref:2-polyprenyl-6-methoxyphenol hydroxylase-like FAD-dependent oxidoreductase n=1 Tax=Nonomuraea endophytica TaxID=714136 RepID=A0A7W8EIN8_9ACTN|nr:FAD-dependent monooxygenase [Nonomuraea endophytica]MBB5080726.1 2-polyprenyl-6-methoxyphenol hydroxylase-like FAD-dependent oxidoreductase [Nonomuraea endophytica]
MDILISGASIAGPALAHWLNTYGFTTTIVERAPALREGGHAVDFRGKAHLSVLRKMGVLSDIEREQTNMGALWNVNEAGKKLAKMPDDIFAGDVEILRGDLGRILYERTREKTEYIFGDSIAELHEDAHGVAVTFQRGATRRFDLVIGADGLHSNVRSLAFGPESRFHTYLGLYNAVFTTPNHLGLDYSGQGLNVPGKMAASYSSRANTEAKAVFFFGSPELTYDRHDTDEQKRLLADAFKDVGWIVPRLLEDMWKAEEFYFDSISQIHMDRWSRGRIALVGDAAWCPSPLSGMGTGLSVVGAYVLAGEIAAHGHVDGFAAYERIMRDYVAGAQKSAVGVSKFMVPDNKFMAWFMNQNYKLLPYLPWKGIMAKSVRKTAEAITLPEYPGARALRPRPSGRAS